MAKTIENYSKKTCFTARDIRDMGIRISQDTPDCAWIPKSALVYDSVAVVSLGKDGFKYSCSFRITEPFRWVTADITLDLDKELK